MPRSASTNLRHASSEFSAKCYSSSKPEVDLGGTRSDSVWNQIVGVLKQSEVEVPMAEVGL
jgi:hypothetical protein